MVIRLMLPSLYVKGHSMKKLLSLSLLLLLFSGCVTQKRKYQWDNVEEVVYETLEEPEKSSPAMRAQTIEKTIEKSNSTGKPVPPGLYAQLGYHYYQSGEREKAASAFETEKNLFPESKVFINRILKTLEGEVTELKPVQKNTEDKK